MLIKKIKRNQIEWVLFFMAVVFLATICLSSLLIERSIILGGEQERIRVQVDIAGNILERQILGVRNILHQLRATDFSKKQSLERANIILSNGFLLGLSELIIVERDGKLVFSDPKRENSNLQDKSFLRSLSEISDPTRTYIAAPFINAKGESTIKISVTNGGTSKSSKIYTAIINMDYFDSILQSINISRETKGALSIVSNQDGTRVSGGELGPLLQLTGDAHSIGARRVINSEYVRLNNPLILELSRSRQDIERSWREQATTYFCALLILILVGGAAIASLQRRRKLYFELLRRRSREKLEQAERMALTLSSSRLGLWDFSISKLELILDKRAAQIRGVSQLVYKLKEDHWKDWIHRDDTSTFENSVRLHINGSSPHFECEYRILKGDQEWCWVHCTGKVVARDAKNRPLRMLGTITDISQRKHSEQEIERLAYYDSLTALPNRRLLLVRLEEALHECKVQGYYCALLFIDMDNFKALNDTLGHNYGDLLLKQIAYRLSEIVRRSDTISRHGGDEFVVLLSNLGPEHLQARKIVEEIGNAILNSLGCPYSLEGREVYNTPSIGVAIFNGNYENIEDVLKHADMAMYQAKNAGRNTLIHFDPYMQRTLDYETELERDLRFAISKRNFTVHYQPIYNLESLIIGAEALIRWGSESGTFRSPAEFIPLAEKIGLIVEIGYIVLDIVCKQIYLWRKLGNVLLFPISVNLSPSQIKQPDFITRVKEVIDKYGVPPQLIKLELTEGILVKDARDVIEKMNILREIGINFSLDDFGTGYSSLSYLRTLPLSQLKIDRSFVARLPGNDQDEAIIKTIICLGGNLGLDVVAEGVESEEQLQFLRKLGCRLFQGFYFSPPCPPNSFEELCGIK